MGLITRVITVRQRVITQVESGWLALYGTQVLRVLARAVNVIGACYSESARRRRIER